jgi:hypothetical protein
LSALIFSKDDVDKATALIKDIYRIADHVVLVDSSSTANLRRLSTYKKRHRLENLDIFHTVALGYADPIRMFGLKKCRYDWVLHLDTDERINDALKKGIKGIIGGTDAHAFAIKRYEEAHLNGKATAFFTWQIRLYNKRFIRFKGIIHEQPEVDGAVERLGDKYRMLHITELKGKAVLDYGRMEMFERFSYETFNNRILDYVSKITMPEQDIKETAIGKIVQGALQGYEALTSKKRNDEIGVADYLALYSLRDLAYQIKSGDIPGMLHIMSNRALYTKRIRARNRETDSKVIFEISKKIENMGITRYLALDEDRTIKKLNEKYAGNRQGIGLLIKLLKDRYYGRYP